MGVTETWITGNPTTRQPPNERDEKEARYVFSVIVNVAIHTMHRLNNTTLSPSLDTHVPVHAIVGTGCVITIVASKETGFVSSEQERAHVTQVCGFGGEGP